ncbi:MAG: hypothetical protein AAF849_20940 [Bacteroidota bacterium]
MSKLNEVNLVIPGGSKGMITCTSHAAYYQKVVVHYDVRKEDGSAGGGGKIDFLGTGEDVIMKTSDGRDNVQIPFANTPADGQINLTIDFYFSPSKPRRQSDYQPAKSVRMTPIKAHHHNTIQILSEDSIDNDDNDSFLVIYYDDGSNE